MNSRATGCTEALAITTGLVTVSSDDERAARLHVAKCEHCSDARDDSRADIDSSTGHARSTPVRLLCAALLGLGAVQAVIALPWLFGSTGLVGLSHAATADHLTRDGAFGLAMAGMALLASWRPRWCAPFAFVTAALLGIQSAAGAVDKHAGRVELHFELTHIIGVVLALLLFVGWRATRDRPITMTRRNLLRLR